jgi:hypothetical protein
MSTSSEWKEALKEAIKIWKNRVTTGNDDDIPCPLCKLSYSELGYPCNKKECPISRMGHPICDDTPFYEVEFDDNSYFSESCQKEVDFLEMVLEKTDWDNF